MRHTRVQPHDVWRTSMVRCASGTGPVWRGNSRGRAASNTNIPTSDHTLLGDDDCVANGGMMSAGSPHQAECINGLFRRCRLLFLLAPLFKFENAVQLRRGGGFYKQNLPVWYCERAPISYRSRLLGPLGHHRIIIFTLYYNFKSAFPLILFLLSDPPPMASGCRAIFPS
jgi:hypothetical protein